MNISPLQSLIDHLSLERIDDNIFRGESRDPGWGRVFGGQVLGQSLYAASQTTPDDRPLHSFHSYFLLPGDPNTPIVFIVDSLRNGGSFTTRRVQAIQHGRPIFEMLASFNLPQDGFEHQDPMPEAPPPKDLLPIWELAKQQAHLLLKTFRPVFTAEGPLDQRPVTFNNPFNPHIDAPSSLRWVRSNGPLPDSPLLHQVILAYSSDFQFLEVSLFPHAHSWTSPDMQVASLDHSFYIHRDFRLDDWLLFSIHSPNLYRSRGLVQAQVFDRKGNLVATAIQEGLVRKRH